MAWLTSVLAWKYGFIGSCNEDEQKILECQAPEGFTLPSPEQLEIDRAEYLAYRESKKAEKEAKKGALRVKLNMTDEDLKILKTML